MPGIREVVLSLACELRRRQLRLVSVESCTGGWIAKACTDVPGSSEWFEGALVVYSDHAKRQLSGVREKTLAREGAVSKEVAEEMVEGALLRVSAADIAVSVSGVAGPGGGTLKKPVGLVCFAWQQRGRAIKSSSVRFSGDREAVRSKSVVTALSGVMELLVPG